MFGWIRAIVALTLVVVVTTPVALLQIDDLQIGNDLKRFKEIAEEAPSNQAASSGWEGDIDRPADATGH